MEKILFLPSSKFLLLLVSVFKESSQPDYSKTLWRSHYHCQRLRQMFQWPQLVPIWLPAHLAHSQTWFPHQFNTRFPQHDLRSHSIMQFIHRAVTQKNIKLVPPKKEPQRAPLPGLLYLLSLPVHRSHPSFSDLNSCSLCSFTLLQSLIFISFYFPKCQEFDSCHVSQSPFPWLVLPIFPAPCYPKGWQLIASCPRFPIRAWSVCRPTFHSASWGPWTRSITHHCQMYFQSLCLPNTLHMYCPSVQINIYSASTNLLNTSLFIYTRSRTFIILFANSLPRIIPSWSK